MFRKNRRPDGPQTISRLGWTFSIPLNLPGFLKPEFFKTHAWLHPLCEGYWLLAYAIFSTTIRLRRPELVEEVLMRRFVLGFVVGMLALPVAAFITAWQGYLPALANTDPPGWERAFSRWL